LESYISMFIDFEHGHHLLQRIADAIYTTQPQMELFNIRQDIFEYKTTLRTIHFKYEKSIPQNDFEKKLLEKYIALHEHAVQVRNKAKKIRRHIANLYPVLEPLWQKYAVLKEKADKAANRVFIPSPKMKGAFSDAVQVYIPTPEEAQKAYDDLMQFSKSFHARVTDAANEMMKVEKEVDWVKSQWSEEELGYTDPLFNEVDELFGEIFNDTCDSFDVLTLDDEHQEFLGDYGNATDELSNANDDWANFIERYNVFMNVYNHFVEYTNGENIEEKDEELDNIRNASFSSDDEGNDLRAETIRRYKSDLELKTNTYFDSADWHIILDHYQHEFDRKNFEAALKRAFEQHPDETTLQIRKAHELAEAHQYQQALELLKKVEQKGPPYNLRMFTVKANVYRQLKNPDLAIPLYYKIINHEGGEIPEWKKFSYECLVEIYDEKKNYEKCLELSKALLQMFPDDETVVERTGFYYNLTGCSAEAENLLMRFIQYHPQSANCMERLGHVFFDRKEYRKAIEWYDKTFAIDKEENYGSVYHKGKAWMLLKEYDEAAVCFEQCLLFYKLSKEYHVGAAQAYEKLNMQPQVIHHFREALKLDPDCKEAIDYLMELNKKKINL
jgi:tetratricopeptide (TPR) repeat protein